MALEEKVKQRFGIHRGIESHHAKPNSLKAIEQAIRFAPPFVEFDVMLVEGVIETGHPPQEPLDKLGKILPLFEGKKTYPKIDIKLNKEPYSVVIDAVLRLINQVDIDFVLINISGEKVRDYLMRAEKYLAMRVKDNTKIRVNIDLARYRSSRCEIDEGIKKHVEGLGDTVYSISPEIHEEDWEKNVKFAEEYQIMNCCFWLRGWPDEPNPNVTEKIIREALGLERKHSIKVYFDINFKYVEGFKSQSS